MSQGTFETALARFDALHAGDPEVVAGVHGEPVPRELDYARRMSDWVSRLRPEASESLRLAARSQHLCRWERPRADYPEGRQGYHRWRNDAKKAHAERAGTVLREVGYSESLIDRVRSLIEKRALKTDPEAQVLEDAACLVFLERDLSDFAKKHETDKLRQILLKTWKKMSSRGRAAAQELAAGQPWAEWVE